MNTVLVIALLLVVSVVLFNLLRSQKQSTPAKSTGKTQTRQQQDNKAAARSPWRATSIVPGEDACAAVQAIGNKRFLDRDRVTPSLPLDDCDVANCTCKYAHHEDRRESKEDRRQPRSLHSELYSETGNTDRRARKRGRRKTDWE